MIRDDGDPFRTTNQSWLITDPIIEWMVLKTTSGGDSSFLSDDTISVAEPRVVVGHLIATLLIACCGAFLSRRFLSRTGR